MKKDIPNIPRNPHGGTSKENAGIKKNPDQIQPRPAPPPKAPEKKK